jgi:hypothetical protein
LHFGLVDYQSQVRALVDGTVQNAADEVIEGVVHRALESIPNRTRLAIYLEPHPEVKCWAAKAFHRPLMADHDDRVVVDGQERVLRKGEALVPNRAGLAQRSPPIGRCVRG